MLLVAILLMIIGGYSINAIGGYSINAIGGYYINDYWWLFC